MNASPAHRHHRPWHWRELTAYFRQCLQQEQMYRLEVSLQKSGSALLRSHSDQIITPGAPQSLITDPTNLQQVRQLLARRARSDSEALYYAYPVVVQERRLIPVCYTQVATRPGPQSGTVLIQRRGELLVNRRFLLQSGDLSEAEVASFANSVGTSGHLDTRLRELLGDGAIKPCGMLFRAEPDAITGGLLRELEWIQRQQRLSSALMAYIQDHSPALRTAPTPGVTVVRSNPAQDKVLRNRSTVLQVVSGPPGTGKTQTIVNLIASTVCDGETVLFISKNNTAVDNVYDQFLELGVFPGILRLGSQEARARAGDHLKAVLASLQKEVPAPEDGAEFQARGLTLIRKIARLEEELDEVQRLQAIASEMSVLVQRTEEELRDSGLYRFATDLADQITRDNADQFEPRQLIALRRLVARTANWQDPPIGFWLRVLARLGFLDGLRLRQMQRWLHQLRLPLSSVIGGQGLQRRLDSLLRFQTIYPFLLATARHLRAEAELSEKRTETAIRSDLDAVYGAKVEYDRQKLARHWHQRVRAAQPQADRLMELGLLFEHMAAGTADRDLRREWWQRYGELLSIFPVICATNLSLAGTAPNEVERFDLVILDEASQSDIASFLPALYRARRACVVGDDQQLNHISNLGAEEDDRLLQAAGISLADTLSYHRHSAFDHAKAVAGKTAFTLLDRHYRCVPEIIAFCNQHFYDGQLKVERSHEPTEPLPGGLPSRGFLLDDIPGGGTDYLTTGSSRSACNRLEAERVIGLVQQYIAAGLTDIGVVTPFRAQRKLLDQLRNEVAQSETDPAARRALQNVEIGTIHTFQGGQHRLMLFSTVVAPGARGGTIRWFEENRKLLNVAISRAKDLLIVACHRVTLAKAGGILTAMVTYADGLASWSGALPPLPPGMQPERLGLLPSERDVVAAWRNLPDAVAQVLNPGEQVLHQKLLAMVEGTSFSPAPKMRVLDCLNLQQMPDVTPRERDYAFRAHFDIVLVDQVSSKPVAAVELDGAHHRNCPLTQARDRLKNSLCEKAGLPLIRVRWGDWGALDALETVLP